MTIKLNYDLSHIKRVVGLEDKSIFDPIFRAWAVIYRAAMQLRFSVFSRGGGDWPPLSPYTIAARRKGTQKKKGKKPKVAILIDTGTLFNTLQPAMGVPGQIEQLLENGIRVGIGGTDVHPSGITIGQIASWHQEGGPKLPQRKILVEPDDETKQTMIRALDVGVQKGLK